jgi:hypothetical protein
MTIKPILSSHGRGLFPADVFETRGLGQNAGLTCGCSFVLHSLFASVVPRQAGSFFLGLEAVVVRFPRRWSLLHEREVPGVFTGI